MDRTESPGGTADQDRVEIPAEAELRQLGGVKWNKFGPDVVPAWVADMDLRPPSAIRRAVAELAERGDFGYHRAALEQIPQAFAAWQERHHGWSPDPERVRVFCDVLHAIDIAIDLHTGPGDGIVVFTPIYPPFLAAVEGPGRRVVPVPLDPDGWRLDPDRLEAAIDSSTSVILICNPHNPTGRAFDDDELAAVIDVAERHDLLVISDEVWADLLHPGAAHRPMALVGEGAGEARTMTITSASKAFNLAGLRCAVATVGHRRLADHIDGLARHALGAVGTPGAVATLVAWTEGAGWLDNARAHLTARRDQLADRLARELPAVGFVPPEATYLAWLDLTSFDLGPDPSAELVHRARIGLSPGPDFGPGGPGRARLNFATSAGILDEIVDRLVAAVGT